MIHDFSSSEPSHLWFFAWSSRNSQGIVDSVGWFSSPHLAVGFWSLALAVAMLSCLPPVPPSPHCPPSCLQQVPFRTFLCYQPDSSRGMSIFISMSDPNSTLQPSLVFALISTLTCFKNFQKLLPAFAFILPINKYTTNLAFKTPLQMQLK